MDHLLSEIQIIPDGRTCRPLRTHCYRGHELTPENTRVKLSGNRACRTCINQRKREALKNPDKHQKGVYSEKGTRNICRKGHPLTPDNISIVSGERRCATCRSEYNKQARTWGAKNRDRMHVISRRTRMRALGLTIPQFEEMELRQGGVCKICGGISTAGRRLAVDHCHKTKIVRGLLCHNCNSALGLFKDNPSLLLQAALYLMPKKTKEGKS
jgi:hypothetical protein